MRSATPVLVASAGAILLVLWEAAAFASGGSGLIPHAWEILGAAWNLVTETKLLQDAGSTLARTVIGFLIAVVVGVPIGVVIGNVPRLRQMFGGWIDFFRSIPAFVALPCFLATLHGGEAARIAMIVFGCVFVLMAHAAMGVRNTNRERLEAARLNGANSAYLFFRVSLMDALPQIADGARIALSLALILALVSEIMLGASSGLGTRVNDSLAGWKLSTMYALIALTGALGYGLAVVSSAMAKRLTPYGR